MGLCAGARARVVKALAGFVLLGGYIVYFRATARSLGKLGTSLLVVIFGLILWWLIDIGFVPRDATVLLWVIMVLTSFILAVGMTGSFVWRMLTGQHHVTDDDDADEVGLE